jgi:hypothetical protein
MVKKGRTNDRASEVHSHTATFSLAEITGNTTEIPITTYVERASIDGCRRYRDEVFVEPPSPVKRQRAGITQTVPDPPLPNVDLDNSERYQMGFDLDDQPPEIPSSTPVRAANPRFAKPSVSRFPNTRFSRDLGVNINFWWLIRIRLCTDSAVFATRISAICSAETDAYGPMPASDVPGVRHLRTPTTHKFSGASLAMGTSCFALRALWRSMLRTRCMQ